jgi:hypothetical protein
MSGLIIRDERETGNGYTAYLDGERIGSASAILVTDTILITHVQVDPDRRDLGIGSLLMRRAFDDARREGHTVLALCPFARRWVDWHPGYRDVAREPKAAERTALAALIAADRATRTPHHGHATAT